MHVLYIKATLHLRKTFNQRRIINVLFPADKNKGPLMRSFECNRLFAVSAYAVFASASSLTLSRGRPEM